VGRSFGAVAGLRPACKEKIFFNQPRGSAAAQSPAPHFTLRKFRRCWRAAAYCGIDRNRNPIAERRFQSSIAQFSSPPPAPPPTRSRRRLSIHHNWDAARVREQCESGGSRNAARIVLDAALMWVGGPSEVSLNGAVRALDGRHAPICTNSPAYRWATSITSTNQSRRCAGNLPAASEI
jgi:hypothetical protein